MRDTNETLNHGNVRRRVRTKTKEHNATATRQAEIIKAQVAKMKEQLDRATARSSKDDKPDEPPPEIDTRSRPRGRSRSRGSEESKPKTPIPIPPPIYRHDERAETH